MNHPRDIYQNFENIITTIKQIEKSTAIFSQLKKISSELEFLEKYVVSSIEGVDHKFKSFVGSVELLSDLVDFQKKVIYKKNIENLVEDIFRFLNKNLPHDLAFLAFTIKRDDQKTKILTAQKEHLQFFRNFYDGEGEKLKKLFLKDITSAILVSDVKEDRYRSIDWGILKVRSMIIFPLVVQGKILGWGFLGRREKPFELHNLSFINLVSGIISLLIYQNFHLTWMRSRLAEQSQLVRVLDEEKYSDYFENGPFYLFSLDSRNMIIHVNLSGKNTVNLSDKKIIGTEFLELIPDNFRPGMKMMIENARADKISSFRCPVFSNNGHYSVMEFLISRVSLPSSNDLTFVLGADVTESYAHEMLENRNELMDELDQFSRILVGQFNNLLTTIFPHISLLRSRIPSTDTHQQQLEAIEKAAHRSANLVQKFLNYDIEEPEKPESGNFNKTVYHIVRQYQKQKSKNSTIKLNLAEGGIKNAKMYPLKIRKLLNILLDNSILALHEKENPVIQISTNLVQHPADGLLQDKSFYLRAGEYIELIVRDNGCGIPERSIKQVFKPFYSTRVKNEGVGLGLFIAYNIVKDMKGQIFIESELGQYTEVHIYLPFKEEREMGMTKLEQQKTMKEETSRKPTVLVVDDEYNIRSMMKEIMEMSGLKVFTAGNGRDGLDVYKRHQKEIDLIIIDIVMPIMDGRAAFHEIKKIDPDQKIFIISGYSQREDLDDMLKKGAVGFLRKPFQVKEIVDKIQDVLKISEKK